MSNDVVTWKYLLLWFMAIFNETNKEMVWSSSCSWWKHYLPSWIFMKYKFLRANYLYFSSINVLTNGAQCGYQNFKTLLKKIKDGCSYNRNKETKGSRYKNLRWRREKYFLWVTECFPGAVLIVDTRVFSGNTFFEHAQKHGLGDRNANGEIFVSSCSSLGSSLTFLA